MSKPVYGLCRCLAPLALMAVLACGGGGGGSAPTTPTPPAPPTPPTPVAPDLITVSTLTKDVPSTAAVVLDAAGNAFVTSEIGNRIYKVTPAGVATVFVGSDSGLDGHLDGTGTAARFSGPTGLTIDAEDNLYVCEYTGYCVRKITPAGVVTTVAGNGTFGFVNAIGTAARFGNLVGIARDGSGTIYVADVGNYCVRKITATGAVSTLAGSGTAGNADGTGAVASFTRPFGIAVWGESMIYVTDFDAHLIRQITSAGVVTTLAGTADTYGVADGTGSSARFDRPACMSLDELGNLYVADYGNATIRRVTQEGVVTTVVGRAGFPGAADGLVSVALLSQPYSVLVKGAKIYVGSKAGCVRVVDGRAPVVPTLGTVGNLGTITGGLNGVVTDSQGNAFVASGSFNRIYKITPAGTTTDFATSLSNPAGLAIDRADNLYVAEFFGHRISKITPGGVKSVFAGSGVAGFRDDTAVSAQFYCPAGLACNDAGYVFVTDTENRRIRMITPAGVVTTLAGSGASGNLDGAGTAATFTRPFGIAVYGGSDLYVSDNVSNLIRRITWTGEVTTLAGTPGGSGSVVDGTGAVARFRCPALLSLDQAGNIYVPDYYGQTIRKVTPDGVVTTISGTAGTTGSTNGPFGSALYLNPIAAWVSGTNLYISDSVNSLLRKVD